MTRLLCLLFLLPLFSSSQLVQTSDEQKAETTIKWTTGLSWDQVKHKAKAENKYIFLDLMATWCGPCKLMDKSVYTNDTVGAFFNKHFISVKVQMDQTKKDDPLIQKWYTDAIAIGKQYHVEAFPTFIFLSPDNVVVNQEMGYKGVLDLVTSAQKAIAPDRTYKDPYEEYEQLVADYKKGIKNYDRMTDMINIARKLQDQEFAKQLLEVHTDFVLKLPKEQRYTWKNIMLWASFDKLRSDGPRFKFFYEDGEFIDKIMKQKGYSEAIILKTIQHEVVDSFYRMQPGETTTITGKKMPYSNIMFVQLPVRNDGKIEPIYTEADWKLLRRMVKEKFGKRWADKAVLQARIQWYRQLSNIPSYVKYTLKKCKKYPPNIAFRGIEVNQFAWEAFLYITDRRLLKGALHWSEQTVKVQANPYVVFIDTYASLLYKLGHTKEAIEWEEKALVKEPNNKEYQEVISQMKKGEPIYLKQGAIWE